MVKIVAIVISVILLMTACSAPKDSTAGTTANEVWYEEMRPGSQIINGDVYMAVLEAAMESDAPLTADEVSGIIGAYGFDLSQLSEISGGRFSEGDVTCGRMTSDRAVEAVADYEIRQEAYALNLSAYMQKNGIKDDVTAEEIIEWFREQSRTKSDDDILSTGQYAAKLADNYDKEIERTSYFSEKYNDPNTQCFMVQKNAPLTASINIPAGWYDIRYMGDAKISALIDTGTLYKSGKYPLYSIEWSDEAGTMYDIYSYLLCPGFTISVTDSVDGESEWLLLVLTKEIP